MLKRFNTAGPCKADIHYMLSPLACLPELTRLIDQQGYFVIHAPRQTGKTTAMLALAQQLTASGDHAAVMLSVEVGAAFPHDPGAAEAAILTAWRNAAKFRLPADLQPPDWQQTSPRQGVGLALSEWAERSP